MATTVAELITDTEQHLFTGQGEEFNEVLTGFTSAAAPARFTIQMRDALGPIAVGSRISIGLEIMYVWSTDQSQNTATVSGQQGGSPLTTHAAGALVTVNPKFPAFRILRALQQEVQGLASPSLGIWRPHTLDIEYNTSTTGYDLVGMTDGDVINVHRVQYRPPGPDNAWRNAPGWHLQRGLPVSAFASGLAVTIPTMLPAGSLVRVVLRRGFGALGSDLTADVEAVTGFTERAHDILPIGAALRLYTPREFKRGFTEAQPEPRRWEEVPATAQSAAANSMRGVYQQRLREHASYLATLYPSRPY